MRRQLAYLVIGAQAVTGAGLVAVTPAGASSNPPAVHASQETAAATSTFVAFDPTRLLDTRDLGAPLGPDEGISVDTGLRAPGVEGRYTAVVINLTATQTLGAGFVQALPGDGEPGGSSTLNVERPGQTVANLAVVPLADDGTIALYTQSGGHLIVDLLGAFVASGPSTFGRYTALPSPQRFLDTRADGGAPLHPDESMVLGMLGVHGVPASGVAAVALNLTITDTTRDGYVQVVPTDADGHTEVGTSSNLNALRGQTVANTVIVPVGADGTITLFSQAGGHLLVDVTGWFSDPTAALSDAGLFVPLDPQRILDTRSGARPGAGASVTVSPLGTHSLPTTSVAALMANLTVTEAAAPGFVQALPTGTTPGGSSNLNVERAGQVIANAAVVTLSPGGSYDLYTQSGAHLLTDVSGYFTAAGGTGAGGPDPTVPTTTTTTVAPTTTSTTVAPTTTTSTTVAATTTTSTTVAATTTTTTTIPPTTTTSVPPVSNGSISMSGLDTQLGNGPRLVFSTVNEMAQPARTITLTNISGQPVAVTGLSITGTNASAFSVASGQVPFTIPAFESRTVSVEYHLASFAIVSIAKLTITTNAATNPTLQVDLGAIDANDFEGSSEPKLSQIFRALGYTTDSGITGPRTNTTRDPAGEEVVSKYWVRANAAQPVKVIPLARYVSRTAGNDGQTRWLAAGATASDAHGLFSFAGGPWECNPANDPTCPPPCDPLDDLCKPVTCKPATDAACDPYGGQNQRLLPVPSGTTTFSPTTPFQLSMYSDYSNDGMNKATLVNPDGSITEDWLHDFRFWPAKDPSGAIIPNTWIVGHDKANTLNGTKNFDYQDEVLLLVNVQPSQAEGPLPGAASLSQTFSGAAGGPVDKAGQGTGFAGVLDNKNGGGLASNLLDLDTDAGVLRVTSDPGTYSGSTNTQKNALYETFGGSRGDWVVRTTVRGPLPNAGPAQYQGVWVGPDQDTYLKWEVEPRGNPQAPTFVLFYEQNGTGKIIGTPMTVPNVASVTSLELILTGDMGAGTVTASYRINGGSPVDYTTATLGANVLDIFSRSARAGIVAANQSTPNTFVATFDDFSVTPLLP